MKRLIALSLALALAACAFCGCAPEPAPPPEPSPSASEGDSAEHGDVELRVAVPAELEGVLLELQDAYASDKPWLAFSCAAYSDEAGLAEAVGITPGAGAPSPEASGETASPSLLEALVPGGASPSSGGPDTAENPSEEGEGTASGAADDADGAADAGAEDGIATVAAVDIVFGDAPGTVDLLEEAGLLDPATRLDMLEGYLVLAAGADSGISSATAAELQAGIYRLAVVAPDQPEGQLQREVLASLGLYGEGAFTGGLAPAPASGESASESATSDDAPSGAGAASGDNPKVLEAGTVADEFAMLEADPDLLGIVRAGDCFRYGAVKVVGSVPPGSYAPIRYPAALAPSSSQEARDQAADFLRWMTGDETAGRIIEKWGFRLAA